MSADDSATKNTKRSATKITKDTKSSCFVPFVFFVAFFSLSSVASAQETIAEIRVHGNHTTPDADVIGLSGLMTGADASEAHLREAEQKLKSSDRFDNVEVRRRFRSIDNSSDILIVILVDERTGVSTDDLTPGPLKRFGASAQWLPVLNYLDGYGMTYGVRVAFADVIGDRSRVSVPLTWGGERRAGVELERAFDSGPVSFVRVGGSVYRRVNPFYDLSDLRQEARVEVDRTIGPWLRAGAHGRVAHVDFGDDYAARHTAAGVHLIADTRIDPSFPRNAIDTRIGWERIGFSTGGPSTRPDGSPGPRSGAGRFLTDARGYIGVVGSTVLALRGQISRADSPLPPPEQALLGGGDSLRGYPTGYRAADSMAAVSAELRVPLTSPLSFARFGVKGFVDAGTTWMSNQRLGDQRFDRGIGGGVYLGATAFMIDLDVAWPEHGNPRAHFGMGVSF